MTSVDKPLINSVVYEPLDDESKNGIDKEKKLTKKGEVVKDSRRAWLICFCAVIDQLFITGLINVFGVFFVEFMKEFGTSKSKTAWLGSLSYGLMKMFAPIISVIVRRYTERVTMVVGSLFCAVSVFSTSYVTDFNLMFVTYPLVYGIGTSLVINPVMVLASGYFDKYITIATGLVCAGSSIGSITLAPLCQFLVGRIGWRMTFRCFTGVYIALAILNLLVKPRPSMSPVETMSQPLVKGLIEDLKLWKNRVFVVWACATASVMFGYYIPNVHMVAFAMDQGIPAETAAYLLMSLGAATTIGRLSSGRIIQYGFLNRLHLYQLTMIITGTSFMVLPNIKSFGGLLAFVIVVGLVDGCYIVLLPILTTSLIGADKAVLAWCFMSGFSSLTFTLGPPVSGLLYDITGTYDVAFHVAGLPIIFGSLLLFFVPWAQRTSTTTNIMRVVSMEFHSPGEGSSVRSGSSDETIHMSTMESGPIPFTECTCWIDPNYRTITKYGEMDSRRRVCASVPGTDATKGVGRCEHCGEESGPLNPTSAPGLERKFISVPRRNSAFIDGYLENLRKAMYTVHLNHTTPAEGACQSQGAARATDQTTSTTSATSPMDRMLEEHIDLLLAQLAARRRSDLSASSSASRAYSHRNGTPHLLLRQGTPTRASADGGVRTRQSRSHISSSRTSNLADSGVSEGRLQEPPMTSESHVSDVSGDSTQSDSRPGVKRKIDAPSNSELDVFCHLFKDDEPR